MDDSRLSELPYNAIISLYYLNFILGNYVHNFIKRLASVLQLDNHGGSDDNTYNLIVVKEFILQSIHISVCQYRCVPCYWGQQFSGPPPGTAERRLYCGTTC